jgi:hypothetical protein
MTTISSASSTFFITEGVLIAREAVQALFPKPSLVRATDAAFESSPTFEAPEQAKMIRFRPVASPPPQVQVG